MSRIDEDEVRGPNRTFKPDDDDLTAVEPPRTLSTGGFDGVLSGSPDGVLAPNDNDLVAIEPARDFPTSGPNSISGNDILVTLGAVGLGFLIGKSISSR
jgi:hypothetical protein